MGDLMADGVAPAAAAAVPKAPKPALLTSAEAFPLAVTAYVAVLFIVDQHVDLHGQWVLGASMWAVLLASLRYRSPGIRATALGIVVVATLGECTASLWLKLYIYRLDNLPMFIPPGHALLYVAAVTATESRFVQRFPKGYCAAAALTGIVWAILGLTVLPQKDLVGALALLVFLWFLWIGRSPQTYAAVFFGVSYLELYGTWIGTWEWQPHSLGLDWLLCGNPPVGAPAGYVLFEFGAFIVGPWIYFTGRTSLRRLRP
jgi:hypothetical protein